MLTRCPGCETTFRVTAEQLKARHGQVRCGACQKVFNALDTLIEAPLPLPAMPPTGQAADDAIAAAADGSSLAPTETSTWPTSSTYPDEAAPAPADASPTATAPSAPEAWPEASPPLGHSALERPEPSVPPVAKFAVDAADAKITAEFAANPTPGGAFEPSPEAATEPAPINPMAAASAEPPPADSAPTAPTAADLPQTDALTDPDLVDPLLTEPAHRARRWPWLLGAVVALGTLALQVAMHFRTEIVVLHPETRPAFLAACDMLACQLRLPRKAALMSIETSDLHPDADGRLTLSATLRNRAPFAQEYPSLELTLTDTADRALVRRVLAPADYLPPRLLPDTGLAAGKEVPVDLAIEVTEVAAAGYRLYLFYP